MTVRTAPQQRSSSILSPRRARSRTNSQAQQASNLLQRARQRPGALRPQDLAQLQGTIGNQAVNQMMGATVQREDGDDAANRGRPVRKPFGEYLVIPNDQVPSSDFELEQITESRLAEIEIAWNALQMSQGYLRVTGDDDDGVAHPNFRKVTMERIGKLMSRPVGRALIMEMIMLGPRLVVVKPSTSRVMAETRVDDVAAAKINADGTANTGSTCTVYMDDDLTDKSLRVMDETGRFFPIPIFIALGHELIHANSVTHGMYDTNPASDPLYPHLEEESAIEGTGRSENALRAEHGLRARYGHNIQDRRR